MPSGRLGERGCRSNFLVLCRIICLFTESEVTYSYCWVCGCMRLSDWPQSYNLVPFLRSEGGRRIQITSVQNRRSHINISFHSWCLKKRLHVKIKGIFPHKMNSPDYYFCPKAQSYVLCSTMVSSPWLFDIRNLFYHFEDSTLSFLFLC